MIFLSLLKEKNKVLLHFLILIFIFNSEFWILSAQMKPSIKFYGKFEMSDLKKQIMSILCCINFANLTCEIYWILWPISKSDAYSNKIC